MVTKQPSFALRSMLMSHMPRGFALIIGELFPMAVLQRLLDCFTLRTVLNIMLLEGTVECFINK